ncbi:uncharacterized protein LOC100032319 isoform X4 [Monodelphis domestica]|uniref:uncharacterized protein LOC100032319 isoform X4 n=1 Tax=Monodelphis domestica TaxID=13616 RepID=UPI0007B3FB75|nr:uncharacterized protein LOC100032319 isoform X4 [Monodelphis domestica]
MASSLRTGSGSGWTAAVRRILQHFSSSQRPGSSAFRCLPLMVEGQQVGLVVPAVARELRAFPEVFVEAAGCLELRGGRCPEERTEAVAQVLARLRAEGRLARLAQWRDEAYEVRPSFGAPALLRVERAAAPLLGILQFGAHLNAFVQRPAEGGEPASWETRMWLARRSPHKATYPGLLDNLVREAVSSGSFKPNCALVVLDFLLRHGLLHPDQGKGRGQEGTGGRPPTPDPLSALPRALVPRAHGSTAPKPVSQPRPTRRWQDGQRGHTRGHLGSCRTRVQAELFSGGLPDGSLKPEVEAQKIWYTGQLFHSRAWDLPGPWEPTDVLLSLSPGLHPESFKLPLLARARPGSSPKF